MNRADGSRMSELNHLKQSIADILSTPQGSRVMRRAYGSRLFELVDAPMNRRGVMDVVAAIAEALDLWEPRLQLRKVTLTTPASDGRLSIDVQGIYTPNGQPVTLDGLVI